MELRNKGKAAMNSYSHTHEHMIRYNDKNLWYVFFPIFRSSWVVYSFYWRGKKDRVQIDGSTPHVVTCNLTKRQAIIFFQLHKGIIMIIIDNCTGSCVPQMIEGDWRLGQWSHCHLNQRNRSVKAPTHMEKWQKSPKTKPPIKQAAVMTPLRSKTSY